MGNFIPIWEILRENWPALLVWFFISSLVAGSLVGASISFALMWLAGKWHAHREAQRLATFAATENATKWHDKRQARTQKLKDLITQEHLPEETKEVNDWPWIDEHGNDLE